MRSLASKTDASERTKGGCAASAMSTCGGPSRISVEMTQAVCKRVRAGTSCAAGDGAMYVGCTRLSTRSCRMVGLDVMRSASAAAVSALGTVRMVPSMCNRSCGDRSLMRARRGVWRDDLTGLEALEGLEGLEGLQGLEGLGVLSARPADDECDDKRRLTVAVNDDRPMVELGYREAGC